MKQVKKMTVFAAAFLCLLLFAACAPGSAEQGKSAADEPEAEQNGPWRITVTGSETSETLSGTHDSLQYSGENISTQIQETPAEGNVFLLMELRIEKIQAGASPFSWEKLYVADGSGGRYQRCANDSFLENYGYKRIKSTDLTLGANIGYICFELPSEAANGPLALQYDSDEGTILITLS